MKPSKKRSRQLAIAVGRLAGEADALEHELADDLAALERHLRDELAVFHMLEIKHRLAAPDVAAPKLTAPAWFVKGGVA